MKRALLLAGLAALALLAACASSSGGDAGTAAPAAVLNYLQALVSKDRDAFIQTFCADFEGEALTEFDSFGAVEARLEDAACEVSGSEGDITVVSCTGGIAVTYQGEQNQVLGLDVRPYRVVLEDGAWKMCGYN